LLDVLDCLKDAGITPKLDKVAAYYLLTFGYMLDDRTLIEGVAKVEAGTSLKMKPGERPIKKYFYKYSNEEMVETCLDKAAQGLYEGLSLAVRAGFEKDREYGYSSVVLLSGGLDSRMNCFFAHHLGFRDVLTLTFGQSNCIDEKIASTIARDLGFEHLFHQLDGGNFLWKALRSCIAVNDGLILFAGSAHAVSTYEMINWGKYGLLHNGNLADVSQGDYVDSNKHYAPEASVWAYSKDLLGRIGPEIEKVLARYPNQEAFAIATRGINAVLNGSVSAQGLTETDEPFLYPELVDFASRLPARYKNGERAFLTMIERYFPEAARYPWQKWGRLPTVANLDRGGKLYSRVFRHGHRFLEKGAARVAGKPDPADMNPFDHWMRTSPGFKRFFSDSRESVARFAENHSELGVDALQLFDKGNVIEKTQAMTLVAAAERLGLA
jgi:asparagine synthase (glutamine-hydrolysing)